MDVGYEEKYHLIEENYWWFQARRNVVLNLLEQLRKPARISHAGQVPVGGGGRGAGGVDARVLEVGCSGGPLLVKLQERGYRHLAGIDISASAIALAQQRGLRNVQVMDAAHLTFQDASFDMVIASDILEHLVEEQTAVREWTRVLAPGGHLIVFVPAYQWLWTGHDVVNHHQRRYTQGRLAKVLRNNEELEIVRQSYWNIGLLAPVGCMRVLQRIAGSVGAAKPKDALAPVPTLVNRLLMAWLSLEDALLLAGVRYPCGVSVMAIARKKRQ